MKVEEIPLPSSPSTPSSRIHVGSETGPDLAHAARPYRRRRRVIYFEKANVLHMGDDFFNKVIPFIDVAHGGSVKGYLARARQGHGARCRRASRSFPATASVTGHRGAQAPSAATSPTCSTPPAEARAAGTSKEDFVKSADLPAYKDYNGYADRFRPTPAPPTTKRNNRPRSCVLVGTSGYSYEQWKGRFYPEKFKEAEMLGFHAQRSHRGDQQHASTGCPRAASSRAGPGDPGGLHARAEGYPAHHAPEAPGRRGRRPRLLPGTADAMGTKLGPLLFSSRRA